mmetsp:Transcript_1984/g.4506  ORF Transcript_1984/g.4506 Transcript_1984/m.4506 type:complete len:214 (+) Transcript_1984:430-1071(+)
MPDPCRDPRGKVYSQQACLERESVHHSASGTEAKWGEEAILERPAHLSEDRKVNPPSHRRGQHRSGLAHFQPGFPSHPFSFSFSGLCRSLEVPPNESCAAQRPIDTEHLLPACSGCWRWGLRPLLAMLPSKGPVAASSSSALREDSRPFPANQESFDSRPLQTFLQNLRAACAVRARDQPFVPAEAESPSFGKEDPQHCSDPATPSPRHFVGR